MSPWREEAEREELSSVNTGAIDPLDEIASHIEGNLPRDKDDRSGSYLRQVGVSGQRVHRSQRSQLEGHE